MYKLFGNIQIYVITILLTINFCNGHYLHMSVPEKHMCGAELADVLIAICRGKLNPMLEKKSTNFDYLNENTSSSSDNIDSVDSGVENNRIEESEFLSKLAGNGIFPRVRRSWMSITEDCCKNPCSVAALRSYCI